MSYRVIAQDTLENNIFISTIWDGIDPIRTFRRIFLSDVFSDDELTESLESRRYLTEEEARLGHAELIKKYSPRRILN